MFRTATGGDRIEDVARSVRYAADRVGVEHVGIGSDFDGAITAPVDAGGLAWLTEALLAQGFNESEIARIMGGNALRVFREVLPRE
jgi:membrane dipeptidase